VFIDIGHRRGEDCARKATNNHVFTVMKTRVQIILSPFMVVPSRAGETPVKPVAVWANKTHNKASLSGLDSPLLGATTTSWSPRAGSRYRSFHFL